MTQFSEKVAVIIGTGIGTGRDTSLLMASEGAKVSSTIWSVGRSVAAASPYMSTGILPPWG